MLIQLYVLLKVLLPGNSRIREWSQHSIQPFIHHLAHHIDTLLRIHSHSLLLFAMDILIKYNLLQLRLNQYLLGARMAFLHKNKETLYAKITNCFDLRERNFYDLFCLH